MKIVAHTRTQKPRLQLLGWGLVGAVSIMGLLAMSELGQFLVWTLIDDSVQHVEWRQATEKQTFCLESLGDRSVNKHWMIAPEAVEAKP
ncbi:hypothetical protein [Photobacterium nomapromontoriensis]|uniref:hypothetical protein n=1 Tax=Photobacterium nomapromontoriensis TaxID=2910237 RepID=UPI003D0C714E